MSLYSWDDIQTFLQSTSPMLCLLGIPEPEKREHCLFKKARAHHHHRPSLAFTTQLQYPESILFINKRIYQLCGRKQEAGNLELLRTPSFTNSPMTDFMLPGQAGPGYPRVARWHRLCGVVAQESALPWIGKGCQGADGA